MIRLACAVIRCRCHGTGRGVRVWFSTAGLFVAGSGRRRFRLASSGGVGDRYLVLQPTVLDHAVGLAFSETHTTSPNCLGSKLVGVLVNSNTRTVSPVAFFPTAVMYERFLRLALTVL